MLWSTEQLPILRLHAFAAASFFSIHVAAAGYIEDYLERLD